MKRTSWTAGWVVVAMAVVLAAQAAAQAAEPVAAPVAGPLADRLPSGALLYIGWAGRTKALDESMIGKLFQEPGVARMVGAIRPAIARVAGGSDALPMVNQAWELAGIMCSHPFAVSLLDLDVSHGEPVASAALLIELGKDRADFAAKLDKLLSLVEVEMKESAEGTLKYKTFMLPPGPVSLGYLGDVFFLTLGKDVPARLAAVEASQSLAASKPFADAMKTVGGENTQLAFFADVPAILKAVKPLAEPDRPADSKKPGFTKILETLGVGDVKAIAAATQIEGGLLHTRLRIVSPAPHKGLLMPLAGEPLTEADLAGVPADVQFLAAWKFSASRLMAETRRILREFDAEMDDEFGAELAKPGSLAALFGKDLLESLGQTWVLTYSPSYMGLFGGLVLTVELKDPVKASAAVAKIEERMLAELMPQGGGGGGGLFNFAPPKPLIEKVSAGGAEVHYIFWQGGFIPNPLAPAWAIHKGKLYVAIWPQAIQAAIENEGKDPLVKSPQFAALRSKLSAKASLITYVDTPQLMRTAYPFLVIVWTMVSGSSAGSDIGLKPDWLPPLTTFERHLRPDVGAISGDLDGITIESYGSMPGVSTLPMIPAMGSAALMPALASARGKARSAASMSNLSAIGKGIAIWSAANQDMYPPDLAALIEDGQAPGILVSPLSGRQPPTYDKKTGKLTGEVDYIYQPLGKDAAASLILAYERLENHKNKGTNVLFADLHVAWMDMKEFQEALKKTQDYLKDAKPFVPEKKTKPENF